MNFWKKILIISSTIVVIFVFGYFIGHALDMGKIVSFDSLVGKLYQSSNQEYKLNIVNEQNVRFYTKNDYFVGKEITYSDNLLSFSHDDEKYEFYVFDSDRMFFQNHNAYLFHQEVSRNV